MAASDPGFEHTSESPLHIGPLHRSVAILLADDHVLFRQALRHLLESEPDFKVVGEAGSGANIEEVVRRVKPDVILMDIVMPDVDGLEATRRIKQEMPGAKVIILTMFVENSYISRAARAGADAFISKNSDSDKVISAIRAVSRGESLITRQLGMSSRVGMQLDEGILHLTDREVDLLRLVARGMSNKEIATELHLAESTVKNRLSVLFEKLDVKDRTQAAIYALSHGLLPRQS